MGGGGGVSGAGDVHLVVTLLTQIEAAMNLERTIALTVLIETAIGMVNVDEIATACPERMEAMIFGVADYAASIQSHTASIGGVDPAYAVLTDPDGGASERERHWGDQWHYPLARIAVTCRAHGLRRSTARSATSRIPRATSRRAAAVLGYEGKWAIHPSQIELANEVYTPPRGSWSARAGSSRRCAQRPPRARGRCPSTALIDAASIRMAENLLAKLEQIEARPGSRRAGAPRARGGGGRLSVAGVA